MGGKRVSGSTRRAARSSRTRSSIRTPSGPPGRRPARRRRRSGSERLVRRDAGRLGRSCVAAHAVARPVAEVGTVAGRLDRVAGGGVDGPPRRHAARGTPCSAARSRTAGPAPQLVDRQVAGARLSDEERPVMSLGSPHLARSRRGAPAGTDAPAARGAVREGGAGREGRHDEASASAPPSRRRTPGATPARPRGPRAGSPAEGGEGAIGDGRAAAIRSISAGSLTARSSSTQVRPGQARAGRRSGQRLPEPVRDIGCGHGTLRAPSEATSAGQRAARS